MRDYYKKIETENKVITLEVYGKLAEHIYAVIFLYKKIEEAQQTMYFPATPFQEKVSNITIAFSTIKEQLKYLITSSILES